MTARVKPVRKRRGCPGRTRMYRVHRACLHAQSTTGAELRKNEQVFESATEDGAKWWRACANTCVTVDAGLGDNLEGRTAPIRVPFLLRNPHNPAVCHNYT